MPVTRTRRSRSWSPDLDPYRRHSLLFGPDAVLLAGVAYIPAAREADCTPDQWATALSEMRHDWNTHRAALMAWWLDPASDPATRKPWLFELPGGPGTRPWAWWEFDAPHDQGEDESDMAFLTRHSLVQREDRLP